MGVVIIAKAPIWCVTVSSRRSGLTWRAIEIPVDSSLIDWIGAHICVIHWQRQLRQRQRQSQSKTTETKTKTKQ